MEMKPHYEACHGCAEVEYCTTRCDKLIAFQKQFAKEHKLIDYETLFKQRYHKIVDAGWMCPITGKIVTQLYTDSQFLGVMSDGTIRVVGNNSCKHCGDPNFSVGGRLRELNEKRKAEAEQND